MGYSGSFSSTRITAAPTGVLRVVIQSASLFSSCFRRLLNWPPCSFVSVRLGDNNTSQTSVVKRIFHPSWISETLLFVVHSGEETLRLEIRSYHQHWRFNTLLGYTSFDLLSLKDNPSQVGIQSCIVHGTDVTGSILFDVFYHPVIGAEHLRSGSGVASLYIFQADELQIKDSASSLVATLSLGCDQALLFETSPRYSESPVWNEGCHFICFDRNNTTVTVNVINAKSRDENFGHVSIPLNDLLNAEAMDGWWTMTNCKAGRLKFKAEWRSIEV